MSEKHILIVGSGSVGKRHARNLSAMGCRISCIDPKPGRQKELSAEIPVEATYDNMKQASQNKSDFGVVICSPPLYHVEQTLTAIGWQLPILLEKPISPDLKSALKLADRVKKGKIPLLLGYTWRWWKPLKRVRQLLAKKHIGKLLYVQFVMSAHLADWHPWENYKDFFMASKSLGGGALLDESHWVDLMIWFFGMPKSVFARIEKISNLKIETDDNVNMFIEYPKGLRVSIHLDLFGRPHEKYISFVGEKGTLRWSADPNQISIGRQMTHSWKKIPYACERNDMFVDVAKEFLHVIKGGKIKTCSIEDGVKVLQVIEAARRSHSIKSIVTLKTKGN